MCHELPRCSISHNHPSVSRCGVAEAGVVTQVVDGEISAAPEPAMQQFAAATTD
ncbi:hypothetical protein BSU04_38385 [Caballeronia sordidicola]|uniref:Uncharacterized protein n=1 Tax=Caballeronia sordidicola TaxID=196367 RepID=A0A226WPU9_CABSO|nr:hypothetical protein BSU04_38385 [Caballeronia sordidicola]